jgi:eukaryotic-like serine/threonine-protein kinase
VDLKVSRTVVVATVPDVVGLAQTDAETKLKDAGFAVKSIRDYSDKPVGQVVGQAPLAGSTLNEGGTVTIAVSQGAVPVVAVPNVVGSSQSAATEKLQQAGFKTAVVDGYSTSVASGVVAGQNPPSGVYAERGATIQITVSKGAPPANTVTVPNVTGKTQGEATQTLQAAGFSVETLQAYDANIPVGSVLGQAPSAGVSSPKGAIVTIAVSKGTAPTPPTTETPTTEPPAGESTTSTS